MEKVIVVISNPQECGDYTINFISSFDGQIIKSLNCGNSSNGFYYLHDVFDKDGKYQPQDDILAKELYKSYGIKLPTTITERYALKEEDIAKMIANKMRWQILSIYTFQKNQCDYCSNLWIY